MPQSYNACGIRFRTGTDSVRRRLLMKNEQAKTLALALLKADSEADVIELLKDAGLWDKQDA
jgi:hypothetical protein